MAFLCGDQRGAIEAEKYVRKYLNFKLQLTFIAKGYMIDVYGLLLTGGEESTTSVTGIQNGTVFVVLYVFLFFFVTDLIKLLVYIHSRSFRSVSFLASNFFKIYVSLLLTWVMTPTVYYQRAKWTN